MEVWDLVIQRIMGDFEVALKEELQDTAIPKMAEEPTSRSEHLSSLLIFCFCLRGQVCIRQKWGEEKTLRNQEGCNEV